MSTQLTQISELKHFKAGDRVWILVLPAELVSTEAPNSYITIRVKVPESGLAAIKAAKPGEWSPSRRATAPRATLRRWLQ